MNPFHFAGVLVIVGLIITAAHFVRMSEAIRANDAEGRGHGPAFVEFLKALGCALVAAGVGTWLLFEAGWLSIAGVGVGSLALFIGLVWYHDGKPVPGWARATVLIALAAFLVSIVAALIRAVS